jgi:hypothetical protein
MSARGRHVDLVDTMVATPAESGALLPLFDRYPTFERARLTRSVGKPYAYLLEVWARETGAPPNVHDLRDEARAVLGTQLVTVLLRWVSRELRPVATEGE